ncbi:nuclear body protein SP140 isoform X2 [Cricetulus griseus]|uniref:Nuclear body protein SP140 isoform X2 n=1 Tax=Cricetulus griseus TaxID=10029 RepID=A0A9J7F7S4_CRIGR|nr:nuclear body protein SP140 isoform X2 [Cricetulus griseus]
MAEEDSRSSSWSTTEDEREEGSDDYRPKFKLFKENKVEIASAITKPFPFLMSLRDRGFLSEQKFQISKKQCKNLDAVRNVVYDILCDLQKDFSLPLLEVIFSPTHLKAYPDLQETRKIFQDDTMETGNNTTLGKSQEKRDTVETRNNTTVGKSQEKTNYRGAGGQAAVRRRQRKSNPEGSVRTVRRRARRLSRNEAVRFKAELLPVTCGRTKGVLHKDKFKLGISMRSIQSENGEWFTPSEFESLGGYEKSRNWRLSLRCYDRSLKFLMQIFYLSEKISTQPFKSLQDQQGGEFLNVPGASVQLGPCCCQRLLKLPTCHPPIDPSGPAVQRICSPIHLDLVLNLGSTAELNTTAHPVLAAKFCNSNLSIRLSPAHLSHPPQAHAFLTASQLWLLRPLPP